MKIRWSVNIAPAERVARVLVGLVGVAGPMITEQPPDQSGLSSTPRGTGRRHGHRLMMIVCCVPMLVGAVVLVATGVAGAGALLIAIACTLMMALMMTGMSHDDAHR